MGSIGPKVKSRAFSEDELKGVEVAVTGAMNQIAESSFTQYIADDHCQWCQHNQLPYETDSFTVGPGFKE